MGWVSLRDNEKNGKEKMQEPSIYHQNMERLNKKGLENKRGENRKMKGW